MLNLGQTGIPALMAAKGLKKLGWWNAWDYTLPHVFQVMYHIAQVLIAFCKWNHISSTLNILHIYDKFTGSWKHQHTTNYEWFFFTWSLRAVLFFNKTSHCLHITAVFNSWTFMWSFSCTFQAAAYLHWVHLKGFSPVWVLMCEDNWIVWTQLNGQISHWYGCSSETEIERTCSSTTSKSCHYKLVKKLIRFAFNQQNGKQKLTIHFQLWAFYSQH